MKTDERESAAAVSAPRATLWNPEHVSGELKWYWSQRRTLFSAHPLVSLQWSVAVNNGRKKQNKIIKSPPVMWTKMQKRMLFTGFSWISCQISASLLLCNNGLFTSRVHVIVGQSLQGSVTLRCPFELSSTLLLDLCVAHRHERRHRSFAPCLEIAHFSKPPWNTLEIQTGA